MNNYTLGDTYCINKLNVVDEIIPQNSFFKTHSGEQHVFDKRIGKVSFHQVINAIETGELTELDKTVVGIVATFGSGCIISKILREMLTMMGIPFSNSMLESSINRLHRFHLINFSRIVSDDGRIEKMKIITLTSYGSQLAKSIGVEHRFNAIATASSEAYAIKSRGQAVQFINAYIKNQIVDSFKYRPVIVVDVNCGAIIRPAASISINNEELFLEVPRRHNGWLQDLDEKLSRYKLVFSNKSIPPIVINGEDEIMNREISNMVSSSHGDLEILYTDDLSLFGTQFKTSLYDFNTDGSKQSYAFIV